MRTGLRYSLLPATMALAAFFIVAPQSGAQATVHVRTSGTGWEFSPEAASLKSGDRVAFVNDSDVTHTATAAAWDTGDIQPGQTKLVTISGATVYACRYHGQTGGMSGRIALR